MSVKPSDLIVEFFDLRELKDEQARRGRLAVGHYYVEDGRPVIGLDRVLVWSGRGSGKQGDECRSVMSGTSASAS